MKNINLIKGVHLLKTMQSAKKRSMPKAQVSTYLDLYVLSEGKERLLNEDERLCMRKEAIRKRLEEINLQIKKLEEEESESATKKRGDTTLPTVKKEWKKLLLGY